ncbi:enolase C-terminal domain-like protein [Geomonas sp.]|uniref:enolase C-terminal domain-like protein n=1 Tax=Geomonas sp. TaxID=2651584 RepID=UPI002B45C1BF|nr:enolase C-terminal domain-like protein [Geomonas sp.]HJV35459.1 enolase C-terminal domain-like protein [Geomonas sp.]
MKVSTIERVEVQAYRIPTERPESDGTYSWDATTLVVAHLFAGGARGVGYTYADAAAATVIKGKLAEVLMGRNPCDIPGCWQLLAGALRNLGESGIGMMAVSALDTALWDLKAKLLEVSLVDLLGGAREAVPAYGSGGFTSYTIQELQRQLAGWVSQGIMRVKMKIGRDAKADPTRVRSAREAIGKEAELFVDANGGYGRKQALAMAEVMQAQGVSWFEEPVVHHDLEGLRMVTDAAPAGMETSSGEYGFDLGYFQRVLEYGAVDVLQADATRCGITGFLQAATLCEGFQVPLSSHCAPSLHIHPCCAAPAVRHLEYFHDHVRIEKMLFEGFIEPVHGLLQPNRSRPGLGLELREEEARSFAL